jgi:DNA-directed RNA polymerase specialized sigma24 family protein
VLGVGAGPGDDRAANIDRREFEAGHEEVRHQHLDPHRDLLTDEHRTLRVDRDPHRTGLTLVLMLRDVEECSNEEVAETLGETIASVKSRLHRARMALREMLTVTYAAAAP